MINDADEYARLWTAIIAASPMIAIGLALFVAALVWPRGWR